MLCSFYFTIYNWKWGTMPSRGIQFAHSHYCSTKKPTTLHDTSMLHVHMDKGQMFRGLHSSFLAFGVIFSEFLQGIMHGNVWELAFLFPWIVCDIPSGSFQKEPVNICDTTAILDPRLYYLNVALVPIYTYRCLCGRCLQTKGEGLKGVVTSTRMYTAVLLRSLSTNRRLLEIIA